MDPQKKIEKKKQQKNGKLKILKELCKEYITKNLRCVWRPHPISFLLRLLRSCWILSRFCEIDPAVWTYSDVPYPGPNFQCNLLHTFFILCILLLKNFREEGHPPSSPPPQKKRAGGL